MANPARIPFPNPEKYEFTFEAGDEIDAIICSIALLTALFGEPPVIEELN